MRNRLSRQNLSVLKLVLKSVEKMSKLPNTHILVTILLFKSQFNVAKKPPKSHNSAIQIFAHGLNPPPFTQCVKKTSDLVPDGFPKLQPF